MIWSLKKLDKNEHNLCLSTISSKAIFAIVGDAIKRHNSISIVRMGDGEFGILNADKNRPFNTFEEKYPGWNKKLGVEGADIGYLQKIIKLAGNSCTYFAPSISGINRREFSLYGFFKKRGIYFDNFYVNDWTHDMIEMLLTASQSVYIIHRDYKEIIQNFRENYNLIGENKVDFDGTTKENWDDNDETIKKAVESGKQLVLFSGGPGGKIIGPKIAQAKKGQVVLDIGNTLMPWSLKRL